MGGLLKVKIVTPYRALAEVEADEVVIPGEAGEMGILPGHAALVSTLGMGELRCVSGGEVKRLAVFGGFVEVDRDVVTVMAETGELAEEIDRSRAEAARDRAERELKRPDLSPDDFERLRTALQRALIRLQVSGGSGG